ncbi:NADH-ubiquinone oxidoreductase subunit 6 [Brevundimonas sp. AAP58]|uniref:NAD(P)/FAD-dependent oxidoreductase n=1 Tax=Brevundimonas sp. AAP58 TaxID=1523422 RepID=UPI0006B9E886|nr:FAD-dependent oxidoreductase [Brevundimonas sp. AAP58]KPF78742.1 NADH-ubiquinone oxidoreductase subunit 6 [Brevundimonas sp. AAP58]
MSPHLATSNPTPGKRQRIAVVGSGISGLSAAWLLGQRHDVTLFEAKDRIGGHSNTVEAPSPSAPVAVDTGFIVYNADNYPNLVAMFEHLSVPTKPAHMSFAVSIDDGAFEYSSHGIPALFAQKRNWVSPKFWRMISDLLRFQKQAPKDLAEMERSGETLDAYLNRNGYGDLFKEAHLLPQAAAIWSCSMGQMSAYPAASFVRFYMNHNLLTYDLKPTWRTVDGGSREYVSRLHTAFEGRTVLNAGVVGVARDGAGATLRFDDGRTERFDAVLLATHSDQALRLLDQPTADERRLLGAIAYRPNRAILHRDVSAMPKRRKAWAAWTHKGYSDRSGEGGVTYWMNELQSLPGPPLFVSLNPAKEPDPALVIGEWDYEHPVFDQAAVAAQSELWSLQGQGGVWFAGAWFGSGFHEDGLQAGLAAAEQLGGVRRPWTVANESGRIVLGGAPTPVAEAA